MGHSLYNIQRRREFVDNVNTLYSFKYSNHMTNGCNSNIALKAVELDLNNKLIKPFENAEMNSFLFDKTYNDRIFSAISNRDYDTLASELLANDLRVLLIVNENGTNVFLKIKFDGWYKGVKLILSCLLHRITIASDENNDKQENGLVKRFALKVLNTGSTDFETGKRRVLKDQVLYLKYQWSVDTSFRLEFVREMDPAYHERKRIAETLIKCKFVDVTAPKNVCLSVACLLCLLFGEMICLSLFFLFVVCVFLPLNVLMLRALYKWSLLVTLTIFVLRRNKIL